MASTDDSDSSGSRSTPLSSSSASASSTAFLSARSFPHASHRVPAWSPQRANNDRTFELVAEIVERLPSGWRMIDLRDSQELRETYLERFYDECMIPNFPDKDELDDLDSWLSMFEPDYSQSVLHILVVITDQDAIAAGVVSEYYPNSDCGLLSYLLVQPNFRGSKPSLARVVTDASLFIIDIDAQLINRPACRFYFCETNSPLCIPESKDVLPPAKRVAMFNSLKFRLVEFPYVQPPLSDQQRPATYLLLLAYNRNPENPLLSVDSRTLKTFLHDYSTALGASDYGVDFHNTMAWLDQRSDIRVSSVLDFLETNKKEIQALNTAHPRASL